MTSAAGAAASSSSSSTPLSPSAAASPPYKQRIWDKLTARLRPASLDVVDESHLHAGHAGNPDTDGSGETHFRVRIVSDEFSGMRTLARHRLVYDTLSEELRERVHALSMSTRTRGEEAEKRGDGGGAAAQRGDASESSSRSA